MASEKEILYVKNMVCPRCIAVVRQVLEEAGFDVQEVELGQAVVDSQSDVSLQKVNKQLQKHGFELLQEKNQQVVQQVKSLLIRYVQQTEAGNELPKLSDYLSERLHQNYASLSSVFSKNEDVTIQKYLIYLQIERVKELLSYGELTLSEIAWQLNYSSVAHLSGQFKKVTGMSVTDYKKASDSFRKPLDGIGD